MNEWGLKKDIFNVLFKVSFFAYGATKAHILEQKKKKKNPIKVARKPLRVHVKHEECWTLEGVGVAA